MSTDEKRNGPSPHDHLDAALRRAAGEAEQRWHDREEEIRSHWEHREDESRQAASQALESTVRDWERESYERSERLRQESAAAAAEVDRRVAELQRLAQEMETERRRDEERSLWAIVKRWWVGLVKQRTPKT